MCVKSVLYSLAALFTGLLIARPACAAVSDDAAGKHFSASFSHDVRPFLQQYCVKCHGKDKTEADLDLSAYGSMTDAAKDSRRWNLVIERLEAGEMPPKKARMRPPADARQQVIAWFRDASGFELKRNAGDPGIVLARRLSNAEYDYTIRDLTGVDIRPGKEFPVDPSNTAGFDNSGESLMMSPSLLKKYLEAAHLVSSYMVLKPKGFEFAPHPMLAETDRDQYCVQRIISFYHAQDIDYADYFEAAWRYKYRSILGRSAVTLEQLASQYHLSDKYLNTVWETLDGERADVGPLVKLQAMWQQLQPPTAATANNARAACEQMRDYVVQLRKKVEPRFLNISAGKNGTNCEPVLIWKNVQYATHRMTFDATQLQVEGEEKQPEPKVPEPGANNEFGPGKTVLIRNRPGDPDLVVPAGERARYEAAFAKFCRVFPDRFYMQERGRNYFDTTKDRGRYLSAGFHSLMGYFRDDQPLYELLLSDDQRKQLDAMWNDLDFVASASSRTYSQFCGSGQRGEHSIAQNAGEKPVIDEQDVTSEARIKQLQASYLEKAKGADARGIEAINYYFTWMNDSIRATEKARQEAEPSHLVALLKFASRAFRRPLSKDEQADVLSYYRSCRQSGLTHEEATREGIVSVLMSPDLCYRIDLVQGQSGVHPLSDYELASRLSYFLWSSMPDQELLARAAAGDLHQPGVLAEQARRMLKDARVRALAVEFGGNWLDFRRFGEIATVDRERFPTFSNELRDAMFEEPVRFLVDAFQTNRSVLDFVYGNDTFVNPLLARHYGIAIQTDHANEWVHIENADSVDRGGILGMAAFMTKNAPGLRTSPVKRGNWVVKNILGEVIQPPPPNVPELPRDEAKLDLPLRDMLARHRQDPSCAGCHARFDSFGLVFEGFGPVGQRRDKDLAGRTVDASATFPDGAQETGLAGLRKYIREKRQNDYVDNLSRKLLAYALGRSSILSDSLLVQQMRAKLAANGYRFDTMIESIVTSPQFLNKRGRDDLAER